MRSTLRQAQDIWEHPRGNFLSHRVFDTCESILDACCDAGNALMAKSEVIASIGTRGWAQVKIEGGWHKPLFGSDSRGLID
jgi:hypothetical protein